MKAAPSHLAAAGRILIAAGACVALYLASMALGRTALPGCTSDSSCQDVLQSRWAFAFGIPVSFLGFVLYSIALLLSGAFVRRERTFAGLQGAMAVSTIIAGGFWFMALQLFALQELCVWCCTGHGLAVSGALLLWRSRMLTEAPPLDCSKDLRDAGSPLSNERIFRFTATGSALTAVGLLALGSLSGPLHRQESAAAIATSHQAVKSLPGRKLALLDGQLQINPADYPALGSGAPGSRTALLVTDYTCEWCRTFHSTLAGLAAKAQPPVTVILLPASRTPEAESIQRTLLTVFHAAPDQWTALSALLTSGQIPATPDATGKAALKLIGDARFAEASAAYAGRIQEQLDIANAVMAEAHTRSGNKVLPQLLLDRRILSGAETDPDKIMAFLGDGAKEPVPTGPEPKLKVLTPEIIVTGLPEAESRDVTIKVLNTGAAPLKLGWLAVDAGCEVISLPERAYYPGEAAAIGLRVTTSEQASPRRVKIHSNSPGGPAEVTLRVTALPQVATSPAAP